MRQFIRLFGQKLQQLNSAYKSSIRVVSNPTKNSNNKFEITEKSKTYRNTTLNVKKRK